MKTTCSAPGKVILFGEHAVVYGSLAVAASLSDLRISVNITQISPGSGVAVQFSDAFSDQGFNFRFVIDHSMLLSLPEQKSPPESPVTPDQEEIRQYESIFDSNPHAEVNQRKSLVVIAYLVNHILPEVVHGDLGISIEVITYGLPVGAGLGSSAAFCVSMSGALIHYRLQLFPSFLAYKISSDHNMDIVHWKPFINQYSFAAETIIHGNPSGLDNTVSCYGGFLQYSRSNNVTNFSSLPSSSSCSLSVIITNTNIPRETKVLVAQVRSLFNAYPTIIQPILDSINAISTTAVTSLSNIDNTASGSIWTASELILRQLIDLNQSLLCSLSVSHPSIDVIVRTTRDMTSVVLPDGIVDIGHGLPSKLTGAGGGGCVITFIPSSIARNSNSSENSNIGLEVVRVELERRLRAISELFVCFRSSLGGIGVTWT